MQSAHNRISGELAAVVGVLCPEVNADSLTRRIDEVMANYKVYRISDEEKAADLPEKILMFIASMRLEGMSDNTVYDYTLELNAFAAKVPKPVALITTGDIRLYLGALDGLKQTTVGKKLSVLRSFFGWLVKEEIILRNPVAKIKAPKTPKRLPKSLTVSELEAVREACETHRERALVEVFYSTGCRLSEIANITISDLNSGDSSVRVIGKGDKERTVYLSQKAQYHLKRYLYTREDDCDYLFVAERGEARKLSNATIGQIIDRIEQRADIGKPLTPHVLRHTFAQLSADAGIELADLQHLLGHSDPSTTLTYASVSEERKQQAHRKFHVM